MGELLELRLRDPALTPIREKVRAGERLTREEGMTLFQTPDVIGVGRIADWANRERHGEQVYFVINRYINPSNICVLSCKFCEFAKKRGDPDAYELTNQEIVDLIDEEIREVHIVGGHHPDWPFEHFEEMIAEIRRQRPEVQIKAFTAAEIDYFWRRWKVEPEEALERLKAAGLNTMPGGGAEVFSKRVQKALFPGKAGADRWLEIHRIAHGLGIRTNATILYGHIETYEERVEHLLRLRELQDETGGFLTFIPLEYQVGESRLVDRQASAIEDLKTIAAARLLLDNFGNIEAYWVMLGEAVASIALHWGANDVNGTLEEERIAHAAGAESPLGLAREEILRMIREAGKIPVERDALYNVIKVYDGGDEGDGTRSPWYLAADHPAVV